MLGTMTAPVSFNEEVENHRCFFFLLELEILQEFKHTLRLIYLTNRLSVFSFVFYVNNNRLFYLAKNIELKTNG